MIPFVELDTQYRAIEQEVRAAIDRVFDRSRFILGPELTAFEEEFAAYVGTRYAVGVGSGTEAIHMALRAAGVSQGDAVVTAPNTCVPTASGISATGATVALADVDSATLTLDPSRLEDANGPSIKAVVPVHLYGHPCDMDAIMAVAARRKWIVVEDCAQAHGARYKNRSCGVFGHAAAFSFYPSKNLGAYGDAGAVCTNDEGLADEVRRLRNYGESERYHHPVKGYNSRLDEVQAAVLRVKLKHLDAWNTARRERAAAYREHLRDLPLRLPFEAPWAASNHHLFVIRTAQRDALLAHLSERGIGALIHYPIPLHLQGAYADLGYAAGTFPEAEKACREVLSLPMYPELSLDTPKRVAEAIAEFDPLNA